jgi:hypothetical protein
MRAFQRKVAMDTYAGRPTAQWANPRDRRPASEALLPRADPPFWRESQPSDLADRGAQSRVICAGDPLAGALDRRSAHALPCACSLPTRWIEPLWVRCGQTGCTRCLRSTDARSLSHGRYPSRCRLPARCAGRRRWPCQQASPATTRWRLRREAFAPASMADAYSLSSPSPVSGLPGVRVPAGRSASRLHRVRPHRVAPHERPAGARPHVLTDMAVIWVVIRNGFTRDLADLFLSDLDHHWRALAGHQYDCPPLVPEGKRQSFAH